MIMRLFYSAILFLIIPFILLRLIWRGFKLPAFRSRWAERFAFYGGTKHVRNVIWFHAVSVGEAESVFPLVKLVRQRYPGAKILITCTSPTGSARIQAAMGDSVEHVYLPYDLPCAVSRFLKHFKPVIGVIMETEIWPNLFVHCGRNAIPLFIINARLSDGSEKGYQKFPALMVQTLNQVQKIATQTQEDVSSFIAIGADKDKVVMAGNIKFDLELPDEVLHQGAELRKSTFDGRLVWIAASTHKGEEIIILQIFRELKRKIPELLLVLVPRHPDRFNEVEKLCEKQKLKVIKCTEKKPCQTDNDVYIGNTMGELKMLYSAADVAFVGGSLVSIGGHNVLEAAAAGVAVVFGPHMFNFKEIARGLLAAGGADLCQNKEELTRQVSHLLLDNQQRIKRAENGKAFVQKNQGALQKVFEIIEPYFQ